MSRLRHLEAIFENLRNVGYAPKSEATERYNCVAYAAGDERRRWVGFRCAGYWPDNAKEGKDISALLDAFEKVGFVFCGQECQVEPGYNKVALYADSRGEWTHAALQREDGRWTSKIGNLEDIIHNTPYALVGPDRNYGTIFGYMKRPNDATSEAMPLKESEPRGRKSKAARATKSKRRSDG